MTDVEHRQYDSGYPEGSGDAVPATSAYQQRPDHAEDYEPSDTGYDPAVDGPDDVTDHEAGSGAPWRRDRAAGDPAPVDAEPMGAETPPGTDPGDAEGADAERLSGGLPDTTDTYHDGHDGRSAGDLLHGGTDRDFDGGVPGDRAAGDDLADADILDAEVVEDEVDPVTGAAATPVVAVPASATTAGAPAASSPGALPEDVLAADTLAVASAPPAGGVPVTPTGSAEDLVADPEALLRRWQDVQVSFVDDPRDSLRTADELVQEVIEDLRRRFTAERAGMESQWGSGEDVSTEDMRLLLQKYRMFFNRLIKV